MKRLLLTVVLAALVAPGAAFGGHCAHRARLCFTAVPPDRLGDALEVINQLYVGGTY